MQLLRSDLDLPRVNLTFELRFVSVYLSITRWACFRSSNIRPGHSPAFIGGWQINGFGVATHDSSPFVDARATVGLELSSPEFIPVATRFFANSLTEILSS